MKYLKLYENFNTERTRLDISSRNLKEFPKEFLPLPDSLQILYCYGNNLLSLPTLPDSLQLLYCDNNNLVSLPTLPDSLQTLYCDNNKLVSLPTLPDSLQRLYCDKLFKEIPIRLFKKGLGGFDFEESEVKEYLEKRLEDHPNEVVDVPEKYKHLIPTHLGNDYGFFDEEKSL
jgi:hypothetical protein